MSPIQQMLLGVGAVATKTYVDDVFSTYLWKGTGSDQTINTGLDMAGEGGMVWVKNRSSSVNHAIVDTVRGAGKYIESNTSDAEDTYSISDPNARNINSFTSTGFTLKSDDGNQYFNWPTGDPKYTSWSFRKAPGFCDVVTISLSSYSTNQRVSHSLGCIPGLILLKNTTMSENWYVYHRELGRSKYLSLNGSSSSTTSANAWGTGNPTSTDFGINTTNLSAGMPSTYVAYVFAGGESEATGARCVDFDGSSGYLSISDSSDFDLGSGNWTIEGWVKIDALNNDGAGWLTQWVNNQFGWYFGTANTNKFIFGYSTTGSNIITIDSGYTVNDDGQYHHYAVTRSGNTTYLFVDGVLVKTDDTSYTINNSTTDVVIGNNPDVGSGWYLNGRISNLRLVKGTAVYTSGFRPPYEPLTNITNTKFLGCNSSSETDATVTPGTITRTGAAYEKSSSPFDDPAGFVFGDAGDQGVIKCGSFTTNSDQFAVIDLGWEPQWILIKRTSATDDWIIVDSMRGLPNAQDTEADTGSGTKQLDANTTDAEDGNTRVGVTSTGFRFDNFGANASFVYVALRRPDGYVGKPRTATELFAMDTGNSSSTIPAFDSGFPVDMGLFRRPASSEDWTLINRLTGDMRLKTNTSAAEAESGSEYAFDSNTGFMAASWANTDYQAWMWSRSNSFTTVAYKGDGVAGRQIPHNLGPNNVPEMIWIKKRDGTTDWNVGHKGLNGETNPWDYSLVLNSTEAEADGINKWNDTAPTSTHFTVGDSGRVNTSGSNYIAMLFASVDGISSVGSFTGSDSAQSINCGFQPRFVIIKNLSNNGGAGGDSWVVLDTTRGWGSGNDNALLLNWSDAQTSWEAGAPTSTGFDLPGNVRRVNKSGRNYIYYCHA